MFSVRKMGCNSMHDSTFSVNRPNGYDCYLLLLIKTSALVDINNKKIETKPGTLLLYSPNTPHKYQAVGNFYQNDWMHLETPANIDMNYHLPLNIPIALGDSFVYEQFFSLIGVEFFGNSPSRNKIISNLLSAFLLQISSLHFSKALQNNNAYTEQLIKLRQAIYSAPEKKWNTTEIADSFSLSNGYFHLLYKNTFGTTCHKDVIMSRLDRAKELLAFSREPIHQIASQCGYDTEEHFLRQFRKYINMTPSEYRKNKEI